MKRTDKQITDAIHESTHVLSENAYNSMTNNTYVLLHAKNKALIDEMNVTAVHSALKKELGIFW